MVNQIRLFPGVTQDETVKYCHERNILLQAYSPLGTGRVFDLPEMKPFATKYGKTVAQICLRWSLQMGFLPLPKSANPDRIRENAAIFDFELSAADVATLSAMPTR
jgi:diketogulonate reductase-like aldo/keto reductase